MGYPPWRQNSQLVEPRDYHHVAGGQGWVSPLLHPCCYRGRIHQQNRLAGEQVLIRPGQIFEFGNNSRAAATRDGVARRQLPRPEWHAIPVRDRCATTPCEIGSLARLLAEGRSVSKDHVVAGLIEKRRELASIIDELQRRFDQHRADLTHIDCTLRVLAADLDPETIRPKRVYRRNRYFARNELSRLCLGVLRTAAGEPLSTDDIAVQVIAAKGFDAGDAILRAAIREQVGSTVKRLHRNGSIENTGAGRASKWKLAGA
jgi:hypothetical protein